MRAPLSAKAEVAIVGSAATKESAPVTDKGLFLQNIVAIIWDFDKTLSPQYMQGPIFRAYGIDEGRFWDEVRQLPQYYRRAGIEVQEDACYLGHLLSYVKHGRMPDLSNARLQELGKEIEFSPGIPDFFGRLSSVLDDPEFRDGDLRLEHYIVSTGLDAMIRGSKIAPYVKDIWASVFIEEPAPPGADLAAHPKKGPISQMAGFLDNTTKTRALFEINKGVNVLKNISVNDVIPEEERRVPFKNMIYIADGPSDIPSFSVVRKHGGLAFAVYNPESQDHFEQAAKLRQSNRVDDYGEADYTENSRTDKWLRLQVRNVAQRIMEDRKRATQSRVRPGPVHLAE